MTVSPRAFCLRQRPPLSACSTSALELGVRPETSLGPRSGEGPHVEAGLRLSGPGCQASGAHGQGCRSVTQAGLGWAG